MICTFWKMKILLIICQSWKNVKNPNWSESWEMWQKNSWDVRQRGTLAAAAAATASVMVPNDSTRHATIELIGQINNIRATLRSIGGGFDRISRGGGPRWLRAHTRTPRHAPRGVSTTISCHRLSGFTYHPMHLMLSATDVYRKPNRRHYTYHHKIYCWKVFLRGWILCNIILRMAIILPINALRIR